MKISVFEQLFKKRLFKFPSRTLRAGGGGAMKSRKMTPRIQIHKGFLSSEVEERGLCVRGFTPVAHNSGVLTPQSMDSTFSLALGRDLVFAHSKALFFLEFSV